jgi:hypothetical protein
MKKDVFFYSEGIKIAGHLYLPDNYQKGKKRPGIVIGLGYTGIKEHHVPAIAPFINDAGYIVLAFDYRGFGQSEGHRWRLIPMEQVEDIRSGIDFLIQQPEVDANKIGLFGNSFGGANVIYAAALDKRVKCVVSAVPFANGERWLKSLRRFWEWKSFLKTLEEDRLNRALTGKSRSVHPLEIVLAPPDAAEIFNGFAEKFPERKCQIPLETGESILNYKPESVVHNIAPRPILFFAADGDTMSVVDECLSMYEKAKEVKKMILFPNVRHFDVYAEPTFSQFMRETVAWYKEYIPVS